MPPKPKPKPSTAVGAAMVDNSRKTQDALWLFEQLMNCDPPVILNVTPIAEKTGAKPNTLVKRIHTIKQRFPSLGIVARASGPRQSTNIVAATPSSAKKSNLKVESKDESDDGGLESEVEGDVKGRKGKAKPKASLQVTAKAGSATGRQTRSLSLSAESNKTKDRVVAVVNKAKKADTKEIDIPLKPGDDDASSSSDERDKAENDKSKISTPKTRAGRRSAGIEFSKDDEKDKNDAMQPKPRGRHAISRELKTADTEEMSGLDDKDKHDVETGDTKGSNLAENSMDKGQPTQVEAGNTDVVHQPMPGITVLVNEEPSQNQGGTKRKRQITPETSSPATSSSQQTPTATQKLTENGEAANTRLDMTEVVQENGDGDKPGPGKKPKIEHVADEQQADRSDGLTKHLEVPGVKELLDGKPEEPLAPVAQSTENAKDVVSEALSVTQQENGASTPNILDEATQGEGKDEFEKTVGPPTVQQALKTVPSFTDVSPPTIASGYVGEKPIDSGALSTELAARSSEATEGKEQQIPVASKAVNAEVGPEVEDKGASVFDATGNDESVPSDTRVEPNPNNIVVANALSQPSRWLSNPREWMAWNPRAGSAKR